MYDYIDIHSHLNFQEFNDDREAIIQEMKQQKIATITVGTSLTTSQESVQLAESHENIFATIGVHPNDNINESFDEKNFEKLIASKKVVALGECGLDYARLKDSPNPDQEKKRQKELFEIQIDFAVKNKVPLMIHCRDAYPDALEILKSKQKEYGEKVRGNFHFFTSPIDIAKMCLDIGFTVSFTGPITFAKQYEELVKFVPLEKIMVETDAPYAAPAPYRGKRNSPLYIKEIVAVLSRIKEENLDKVRKQLVKTTFEVFLNKN